MSKTIFGAVLAWAMVAGCNSGPSAGFYEGCADTTDCLDNGTCFAIAWDEAEVNNQCSDECEVDTDCPGNAGCYELIGDPSGASVCYQRCTFPTDCSPGFVCAEALRDGLPVDSICLP